MTRHRSVSVLALVLALGAIVAVPPAAGAAVEKGKPRILCIGAHPDDAEFMAAGSAALWIAKGCAVKLVCATNGDIGHWKESGPALAARRRAEVESGARLVGYAFEILDNHDGALQPTLENRARITRIIREWQADIVITHRPNDYHPDHRYTSVLVQDSAYMVAVPMYLPEVPALKANPVYLYASDRFQRPSPFQADIAVGIDAVMDKKLEVLQGMVSQFYEGGVAGYEGIVPSDPEKQRERRAMLAEGFASRSRAVADRSRPALERLYGRERGAAFRYTEAFEVCEYGRQPDEAEIRRLFPFFE